MVNKKSNDVKAPTGVQIKAARALLRWTAQDLQKRTKLGIMTIRRAEATDGPITLNPANVETIVRIFEMAGIEFTNGEGPGARLKKKR